MCTHDMRILYAHCCFAYPATPSAHRKEGGIPGKKNLGTLGTAAEGALGVEEEEEEGSEWW